MLTAREHLRRRKVRRARRRADIPEIAERFGCDAAGLRQAFRGALREIELSVRRPRVSVIRVLEIPQVGIDLDVFVRHDRRHRGRGRRSDRASCRSRDRARARPAPGSNSGRRQMSLLASATPSPFESMSMTTLSPGVSGVGFRYCGPWPTNSRPRRSNAIAAGLRTRGSWQRVSPSSSTRPSGGRDQPRTGREHGPCREQQERQDNRAGSDRVAHVVHASRCAGRLRNQRPARRVRGPPDRHHAQAVDQCRRCPDGRIAAAKAVNRKPAVITPAAVANRPTL